MKYLDGRSLSEKILSDLKKKIEHFEVPPRLDMILVGDDFGSKKYVQMKQKQARDIGITGDVHLFNSKATTEGVLEKVIELNRDDSVTGLMVQLPLPEGLDQTRIVNAIDYTKDVDGLSAYSLGLLFQQRPHMVPATPLGVMRLLDEYGIKIEGKTAAIIGKSAIVGAPLVALLSQAGATTILCHSRTENLPEVTSKCDIVVSAVGKPNLVTGDFIKSGAVVVDVGISQHPETGKVAGDIDIDLVMDKASYISPVPGGVGPMTIAMLLENVVNAFK